MGIPIIITFRECLEALLIIMPLLVYLSKIGRKDLSKVIFLGFTMIFLAALVLYSIVGYRITYYDHLWNIYWDIMCISAFIYNIYDFYKTELVYYLQCYDFNTDIYRWKHGGRRISDNIASDKIY